MSRRWEVAFDEGATISSLGEDEGFGRALLTGIIADAAAEVRISAVFSSTGDRPGPELELDA